MTPARPEQGHLARVALFATFLIVATLALYTPPHSASNINISDSAEYAVGAANLVEGRGLTIALNGQPHPIRYAPGLPVLLIAPVYAILGTSSLGAGILPVLACALAVLAILWSLCMRFLPHWKGVLAAFVTLAATLQVHYFTRTSQNIMADVPLMLMGLGALLAFTWALRHDGPAPFLIGGAMAGMAISIRPTALALCIPFGLLLLVSKRKRSIFNAACLALPVAAAFALMSAYAVRAFGDAGYTGYKYWLAPHAYALGLGRIAENAYIPFSPFFPAYVKIEPFILTLAGPAVFLAAVIAGWQCRKLRVDVWHRTRPIVWFLAAVFIPIAGFQLFLPWPNPRYFMLFHTLTMMLGIVWGVALIPRLGAFPTAAAVLLISTLLLVQHNPTLSSDDIYKQQVIQAADELLPEDAILVSHIHGAYVGWHWIRETEREYVPLAARTAYSDWSVGKHGEERKRVYAYHAKEAPEAIIQSLADGRRVFIELWTARWSNLDHVIEQLETTCTLEPVVEMLGKPAIAELRLRQPAGG